MAIWATCLRSLDAVVAGETETACRDVVEFSDCWVYTACAPWSSVSADVALAVASSIWRWRSGLMLTGVVPVVVSDWLASCLAACAFRRVTSSWARLSSRAYPWMVASREVLLACVLRR